MRRLAACACAAALVAGLMPAQAGPLPPNVGQALIPYTPTSCTIVPVGTTQATAAAASCTFNNINGGTSANGVVLVPGGYYSTFLNDADGVAHIIYPPTGYNINGNAVNSGITLLPSMIAICTLFATTYACTVDEQLGATMLNNGVFAAAITMQTANVTGIAIPATGIYRPATGTLGLSCNGPTLPTLCGQFDASENFWMLGYTTAGWLTNTAGGEVVSSTVPFGTTQQLSGNAASGVTANSTWYGPINGVSAANAAAVSVGWYVPAAGVFAGWQCAVTTAPGVGNSDTCSLYVNGTASSTLTCQILSTATSCSVANTTTQAVSATQKASNQIVTSTSATAPGQVFASTWYHSP